MSRWGGKRTYVTASFGQEENVMSPNFTLSEGAYVYRPLKRGLSGWDVYALQSALNGAGHQLVPDGDFGPRTEASVKLWQQGKSLTVDGIAGIATQRSLALALGELARHRHRLPIKLLMGLIEKESGYQLGNHTAPYEQNGSRDLGVVQINDKSKLVPWEQAFDVPFALDLLAGELREKHDRYLTGPLRDGATRVSNARAWRLAAGSWNRPAHTAYLAGMRGNDPVAPASRALSDEQHAWIEGYMRRVCEYADIFYAARVWPA